MKNPNPSLPNAIKDHGHYATLIRHKLGYFKEGMAEEASRRAYPSVVACARNSRPWQFKRVFDYPVARERFPKELWDAGFKGWSTFRVPKMLSRAKETDLPVLIQAETGTGKDILANYIHSAGTRREGRFVPVNCAAIPSELLYSELFGHKKGSFTGASTDKRGRFQQADGGTIFLDEIGDTGPSVQQALLRVLENSEVYPLGGTEPEKVNVRIICATHRNIHSADARAKINFRDDFYYRLRVLPLSIPPLRNSFKDLLFLFLLLLHPEHGNAGIECCMFPVGLIEEMLWYDWPGNVRELRNFARFYPEYCHVLREENKLRFKKGTLHPFFSQNDALREFIGDEQFYEVQKKIADRTQHLATYFGDLNYFTVIDLRHFLVMFGDYQFSRPIPDHRYEGGYAEKSARILLATASGNEEYLYQFSPDPAKRSYDSIRGLFHIDEGTFRKYAEVQDRIEHSYFDEVIRWNRTATDNEVAKIAGVHHATVKKIREKYKLSRRINRNRPPSSFGDSDPKPTPPTAPPENE